MDEKLRQLLQRMGELVQELDLVRKEIENYYSKEEQEVSIQSTKREDLEADSQLNAQVLEFLDIDLLSDKLDYLLHKLEKDKLSEQDLDLMAVSVNVTLQEQPVEEKLEDLIRCVSKLAEWEMHGTRR